MLYKFPPPEWFEAGTTSHLCLTVFLWSIVAGLPASLLACYEFGRNRRWIWVIGEAYWILMSGFSIVFLSPVPVFGLGRDIEPWLASIAFGVLLLIPIPAAAVGWYVLTLPRQASAKSLRGPIAVTWISVTLVVLFYHGIWMGGCYYPKEAANRSQCKNNLKQIGLAFHHYHDVFDRFPDLRSPTDGATQVSWRVKLLPYLDQKADYGRYDHSATWDAPQNRELGSSVRTYVCPSVPVNGNQDSEGRLYTAYAALIGPESIFPDGRGQTFKAVIDGASNTLLATEACGQQIVWTEPRDIDLTQQNIGINLPGSKPGHSPAAWSSYHRPGAHMLLADGSVRFVSADTNPRVLRSLITPKGGEEIPDY